MKNRAFVFVATFVAVSLSAFAQDKAAAASVNTTAAEINHWAENLYREYAAATGGKITFQVRTLEKDQLTAISATPFSNLLTPPPHRVVTTQVGTALRHPEYYLPTDLAYGRSEMSTSADKFTEVGLPVSGGVYRKLGVQVAINGDVRQHEALEFCFPAQLHCALLDPVVVFLQSKVESIRQLTAANWAPVTTYKGRAESPNSNLADGDSDVICCGGGGGGGGGGDPCGLASDPSSTYESTTWPAYTVTYKDIFGITLVQLSLAQQTAGMSCTSSCSPAPFATSGSSSSFGNLGYSTACANDGAIGTTGSSGKGIAESKCTYELAFTASASVSIGDPDTASVTLNFNMNPSGGVSSNGGSVADTCGYY